MRIVLLVLLFAGCSLKQPPSKPALVVWKTPQIRYADTGFIRRNKERVELEIYQAGQPLFRLRIARRICLDGGCMSDRSFVDRYLSPYYPRTILKEILLGRPIFSGKNLTRTQRGFIQKIFDDHLDIIYTVTPRQILFKDRKNGIIIKIKELDG